MNLIFCLIIWWTCITWLMVIFQWSQQSNYFLFIGMVKWEIFSWTLGGKNRFSWLHVGASNRNGGKYQKSKKGGFQSCFASDGGKENRTICVILSFKWLFIGHKYYETKTWLFISTPRPQVLEDRTNHPPFHPPPPSI